MLGLGSRHIPIVVAAIGTAVSAVAYYLTIWPIYPLLIVGAILLIGLRDLLQQRHAVLRNYPLLGHIRYFLELIRPEIRQYFLEADDDEVPFSRESRAIVYQRAKNVEDKRPFGTKKNIYGSGYQWITHSIRPKKIEDSNFRITIGGPDCLQPYDASIYNISAMSFGALSANAISALNRGAKIGGFAHDTGEGGISRYHKEGDGDLIYEIGTGYFGCRDAHGNFDEDKFKETALSDQVKMVEIKLSQGAKPGQGGMLPAAKITPEIAEARGIPMDKDCLSPASHSAFSTPLEMMHFIKKLRYLSGGKPVGFKMCIGHRREFMCIVRAMLETDITPDFIVIDGTEGGTGAAPMEFANHMGMPLVEGLTFAHNTLRGAGIRDRIKIGASGKLIHAFDIARTLALGADWCNSARGFMFSIGCIQAQACHTNHCPAGVATQDSARQKALNVTDKAQRVANFHRNTLKALADMTGAAGLMHPSNFLPHHLMMRMNDRDMVTGHEVYPYMPEGFLLREEEDTFGYVKRWKRSSSASFEPFDGGI